MIHNDDIEVTVRAEVLEVDIDLSDEVITVESSNQTDGTGARVSRRRMDAKTRARVAALTMHARHPDAAKRNGRKGGRKTADGYKDGAKVWATRMALARWHGIRFDYEREP